MSISKQYDNYINHFLDKKLDTNDSNIYNYINESNNINLETPRLPKSITLPAFPLIIKQTINYLSKQNIIKNINTKHFTKVSPEQIYNPNYTLLLTNTTILNKHTNNINNINNINISLTIENYINTLFNISKSHLKSNVHPDTIKAIIVPYSNLGFKETGLCCASSYYQLYNRTKPIKKVILLCTNTTDTNNFISTSLTDIISYKTVNENETSNKRLKFDTITIEKMKPYIELNNENIKNEISLLNQLPFIETIAPNSSIIPILISNKIYLDNTNIDKINNIIYILKKILINEDTILICASNFTNTKLNEELNSRKKDIFTNCIIKKQDNSILQFIYDNVNGIKTRSSKIDDILFMQNTPSTSTMTMYFFSQLLNNYSGISRKLSSSSSSISSDDSGISVSSNKIKSILYSRITSYYTSILNKNIDLSNFLPRQLVNIIDTKIDTKIDTILPSISYIGLVFTSQSTIENNKNRVIENLFSEYEKIALISFIKEQLYFNTINSINKYNNNITKIINNPINIPIFKSNLGVFITLYKNNKLRGCIGTSETNNDEYTIENNIKRFIIELSTKETYCRDLKFNPITFDEISNITFNINILYHMKSINVDTFNSNQFNFGCDGLLFKSILNNKQQCKYSLTSISKYFNSNINKTLFLNELCKNINDNDNVNDNVNDIVNDIVNDNVNINDNNNVNGNRNNYNQYSNTYKLFYNEGILLNSN